MKYIRLLVSISMIMFFMVLFTGITSANSRTIVTDLAGRTVEVPKKIDRIVCAGPGALRLIVYLNATRNVVGVEDAEKRWGASGRPYAMTHRELKDLPSIGPGGPGKLPHTEALIGLNPDILFMTNVGIRIADNIQSKTNVPVVVLSYGKLGTFGKPLFKSLELAGNVLGEKQRAKEVVSFIKEIQEDLKRRTENIPDKVKPTVYIGGIGHRGAHGIESTEVKFPPFTYINAKNVVDELGKIGHHFIDKEKLMQWDPDIIFIDEGGFRIIWQDYKKNKEFYYSFKAFRKNDIYGIMPFNFYTTNVGTALADAYYIGKVLYTDNFKDVEPEKKADEIYKFLVGRPVYNEMKKDFGGFRRIDFERGAVGKGLPISP